MKWSTVLVMLAMVLLLFEVIVTAAPEGTTQLDIKSSERKTIKVASNTSALAGNVTHINLTGSSITQSWAGYFGNVTGSVVLQDSAGYRLYQWDIANPSGEVYATTSSTVPTWGTTAQTGRIMCWNYTQYADSANWVTFGEIEGWETAEGSETDNIGTFGIPENAVDSINNTFQTLTTRAFPTFFVGNQVINGTNNKHKCPSIALFNQTNGSTYGGGEPTAGLPAQGGNYQEVILIDNSSADFKLLFTSIIDYERDQQGFNGGVWDFEMIVPEDGHGTDTATTEYNFYVELE